MSKNINSTIFTPVLIGGSLILLISFAIRSTFGLFQIPIAEQFMWARSEFSMAIAIQNLAWGIGTPIFSAFAEKFGDRKAITIGLFLYALGILVSSTASSPETHQLLNILIGFGIAGSGFGPILAVVGRTASAEKRSLALGITTAAGSAGQVVGPPFAAILLDIMPWSSVFIVFAVICILTIIIVPLLKSKPKITKEEIEENLSDVLKDAFKGLREEGQGTEFNFIEFDSSGNLVCPTTGSNSISTIPKIVLAKGAPNPVDPTVPLRFDDPNAVGGILLQRFGGFAVLEISDFMEP